MLFKARFHRGLIEGTTVRSYRRWKVPKVKVGGRYRFAAEPKVVHEIEVTKLETVRSGELTSSDAKKSGFESVAALRAEIERVGGPLADADPLTCVHFHYLATQPEPAPAGKPSMAEVETMIVSINAMEKRSKAGPWVWKTLALIEQHPQRRAADLAEILGVEVPPFKSRVRRLKGLGLTRSFEVGYQLTELGGTCLKRRAD